MDREGINVDREGINTIFGEINLWLSERHLARLVYEVGTKGLKETWANAQDIIQLMGREFGQWRRVIRLFAQSVPMMLVFSVFIFLTSDFWQVAQQLSGGFYFGTMLLLILVAWAVLSTRVDIASLTKFGSWNDVQDALEECDELRRSDIDVTNLKDMVDGIEKVEVRAPNYSTGSGRYLSWYIIFSEAIGLIVVFLAVIVFYLVFGGLILQNGILRDWTVSIDSGFFGFLWERIVVSSFVSIVSVLHFVIFRSGERSEHQLRVRASCAMVQIHRALKDPRIRKALGVR